MSNRIAEREPARLRNRSAGIATCIVALLAFLAVEDITTGVEPGFLGEWLMVAFAAVWFLAVGARPWKRRQI